MQITFSTSCRLSGEFPPAPLQMSSDSSIECSAAFPPLSCNLSCFIPGWTCQFSLSSLTAAVTLPLLASGLLVAASSKLQGWGGARGMCSWSLPAASCSGMAPQHFPGLPWEGKTLWDIPKGSLKSWFSPALLWGARVGHGEVKVHWRRLHVWIWSLGKGGEIPSFVVHNSHFWEKSWGPPWDKNSTFTANLSTGYVPLQLFFTF